MAGLARVASRANSVRHPPKISMVRRVSEAFLGPRAPGYQRQTDDLGSQKLRAAAGTSAGYGSVTSQFIEAREDSATYLEFISRTGDIVCNSVAVTVVCGLCMGLPLAMICIGVQYLQECPKQPKIPIYLLVGGCFGVLKLLALIWKQHKARRLERMDQMYEAEDDEMEDPVMSRSSKFTEGILTLFLFVWFILGNVWVYGIWKPRFEQVIMEPGNWCDETVYMFAFVQIIIVYAMIFLACVVLLGLYICHRCDRK
ncbi:uncharacterized protein LOC106164532 [Lingula anatina]|uniref:Uncharacterized protein LOC106164532 n=1 Tax=Lingula anatina TaxID=7574 RepID=A0A1S3IK83_LINAN|nr:uncharacterized protein LOC106164532 [Lingula anatina]|eukprot:XP_013397929.1 uncharacterized protein LOC106164532 [Lingula anatina]